jgi:hypothetical protein
LPSLVASLLFCVSSPHPGTVWQIVELPGLGSKLSAVRHLTRAHLEQLQESRQPAPPSSMARVVTSFAVAKESIKAASAGEEDESEAGMCPGYSPKPPLGISFTFDAAFPCSVQVFWGVRERAQRPGEADSIQPRLTASVPRFPHLLPPLPRPPPPLHRSIPAPSRQPAR